jgi:hypothetical protein
MGMINLGSVFKSIGSGIKSLGQTALRAVAPAATNLLKGIVGSGFDAFKGVATKLVGNLPGPLGTLASKYLAPLLGKGIDALKGMSQGAIESLVKKLVDTVAPRQVPGAPAGTNVTLPAAGTPERAAGAAAATAAVNNTIAEVSGRAAPSGANFEDALANGAAGAEAKAHNKSGTGSLDKTAEQLDNMSEGEMIKYQEQMQKHARLMDMYSKLIQAQNDMKKGIIANFRV